VVTMGLGGAPKERKKLPKGAQKQLGQVLSFDLRTKKHKSVMDLATYEQHVNPVDDPNSDPTGLAKGPKGSWLAVDSGGNDLLGFTPKSVGTVPKFKDRKAKGQPYESVPTDVVKGPDGAYYVSELTGFPFATGAARIWRVKPGHKPTVWASGLTNVTSLAFD